MRRRRGAEQRQRSPSPGEEDVSPRDRFKDAKEKFLLMERERIQEQQRRMREELKARKDKTFLKRHESVVYPSRYEDYDDHQERYYEERPKPAPRSSHPEEVRYAKETPVDRYRNMDKYDPKRRSMFNLIEDEHRKNSNEIAKELKRRSYMENGHVDDVSYRDRSV